MFDACPPLVRASQQAVKKANAEILEHNRKREVELSVETMRAQLEDEE